MIPVLKNKPHMGESIQVWTWKLVYTCTPIFCWIFTAKTGRIEGYKYGVWSTLVNLSNNKKSCFIKFINVDHKLWSMNIDLIFKLSKFVFMDQKIWSILMNLKVTTCPLLAPGIFDPVMVKLTSRRRTQLAPFPIHNSSRGAQN